LNSPSVSLKHKNIFMDLLVSLYINHYTLQFPKDSLMPDILVWSDNDTEKSRENKIIEEKNKVFTLKAFQKKKGDQQTLQPVQEQPEEKKEGEEEGNQISVGEEKKNGDES